MRQVGWCCGTGNEKSDVYIFDGFGKKWVGDMMGDVLLLPSNENEERARKTGRGEEWKGGQCTLVGSDIRDTVFYNAILEIRDELETAARVAVY